MYQRSYAVEDMTIRSSSEGRIVEALMAVYDVPVPVRDHQGEYDEVIRPGSFRAAIARGHSAVQVLYNHGMDVFGRPSDRFSMPLGVPLEIREDGKRSVVTTTRYAHTPLADEVLQLIEDKAIRGQSFRGDWTRSSPATGFFRAAKNGQRQLVERTEATIMEYGPTPFPVYPQAEILSVRSVADVVGRLSAEERQELATLLLEGTPLATPASDADGTVPGDQPHGTDPGPLMDSTPLDLLALNVELRRRKVQPVT